MRSPAIVIVAYNRPAALERLLVSLTSARYPAKDIPLVISIDKGGNPMVAQAASDYEWPYGTKMVLQRKTNLGLRRHVLACGDLTAQYGAIIMLEDDLYTAPDFYFYATSALNFAYGKDYIAGVALYNHRWNVNAAQPFEPYRGQGDCWYSRFACSWGQAWSLQQWQAFRKWYNAGDGNECSHPEVPAVVASWGQNSWLKHYIAYCAITGRYFMYPYISRTTNFGDAGTHNIQGSSAFQVPLACNEADSDTYRFAEIEQTLAVYDAYFENEKLASLLGYGDLESDRSAFCCNLYGTKSWHEDGLLLTRARLRYAVVRSFACVMRPHEANVVAGITGGDFHLYDTTRPGPKPKTPKPITFIHYSLRALRWKDAVCAVIYGLLSFLRVR